jgi:hypothetical protein
VPGPDGPTGLVLRRPEARRVSAMRSSMCQVCRLVAREETLPVEERIGRAMKNLDAFVGRVAAG